MALTPEQKTAETKEVYDRIHRMTWSRRTAGFLAGATLFGAIGAIGGAIAAFLPAALGALSIGGAAAVALPTLGAIGASIAVFTGAAALLGVVIGGDVGSNSGSVTAGVMEYRNSDGGAKAAATNAPAKNNKLWNVKGSLMFGALFAGFGAIAALSPITASVVTLLGFTTGTAAASVASGTMMGLLGTSLGINFPMMSGKLSNFYMELFKGKGPIEAARTEVFNSDTPQPQQEAQPQLQPQVAVAEEQPRKTFASNKVRFSLQGVVEKTEERSADKDVLITR